MVRVLADLAWPSVAASSGRWLLAVPVGSTEQHGPHLPLSTDADIALELGRRLAARRPDVALAPLLPYGASGEHAGFAGTLSIGTPVLCSVLVEIGRSADAFAGIVFISGHGGNADAVSAAVEGLQAESRRARAWFPPAGGDAHAGRTETSVMLALRPAAVDVGRAAAGRTEPVTRLMPALRAAGVAGVSPNGVLGDPAGASAEGGSVLLETWAAGLSADLDGWP